jgi:choline dehydrogenase-like flavoprotein
MTGGVVRNAGGAPTLADLNALLIPGLAALGVRAELLPLPEEEAALAGALSERLRRGVSVPVYAFAAAETPAQESGSDAEDEEAEAREDDERAVTRQGIVTALDVGGEGRIAWHDVAGQEHGAIPAAFRQEFSHYLRLRRAQSKGGRRANLLAALRRWIAFVAAYPDRTPTPGAEDASVRAAAAQFLREVAGKSRTAVANRLRRAAAGLEAAQTDEDIGAALLSLREAALWEMRLPASALDALLLPPSVPLTDVERREMIYLARAGTRDLRVLAARRLASERHHADARRTLEQLVHTPDAWVRAAATPH